jgi:arginine utilization regulatory protein
MDIKELDYILGVGNFVDYLVVLDENGRICFHKLFREDGRVLEMTDSIGRTPMEVFPSMTEADCPAYRAMRFGERTLSKVLNVRYGDTDYRCTINIQLVTRHGRTIGVVATGKVLDGTYYRGGAITIPEPAAAARRQLYEVGDIIGGSPETRMLRLKIKRVAASPSSVLIHGETGTGKELVAQSIHSASPRRDGPFLSQNCAAIPSTLLESTFFGTTRGSFTGAENRAGVFELANGGTVFLDELNSMDLGIQAKLLKAIEEKTVTRVGGTEPRRIDVRIISAINESPDRCLHANTIRADLFYRLAGVQIHLPPLRERRADLPDLLRHFLQVRNRDRDPAVEAFSEQVLQVFETYDWPGNVRELRNVVEAAGTFNAGPTIDLEDLPAYLRSGARPPCATPAAMVGNLNEALEQFERQLIQAKAREAHSLTELAGRLQVSRQTLKYKLKKHGLDPFRD